MIQLTPQDSGPWQVLVDRAGIEGRLEHGVAQVRQLVEEPDREVGDDDRDVDDREAPRPQPVGERKHRASLSPRRAAAADRLSRARRRSAAGRQRSRAVRPVGACVWNRLLGRGNLLPDEQSEQAALQLGEERPAVRSPRSRPCGGYLGAEKQRGGVEIHRVEEDERRCERAVDDTEPGRPLVDQARGERDQPQEQGREDRSGETVAEAEASRDGTNR